MFAEGVEPNFISWTEIRLSGSCLTSLVRSDDARNCDLNLTVDSTRWTSTREDKIYQIKEGIIQMLINTDYFPQKCRYEGISQMCSLLSVIKLWAGFRGSFRSITLIKWKRCWQHLWLVFLSFIHSGYFYRASSSPLLLRGAPDTARILSEFHAEAPQATMSEGLAQGPYVAARVGVEPMTFRTKGVDSTNVPPTPHKSLSFLVILNLTTLVHSTSKLVLCR